MCSECLNAHEIMRDAFEGHKVMPVKDFQDQQFQNTANSLQENARIAKRGVSQVAEKMIAEIRERERKAIESIETTCVTRLQKINST